MKIKNPIVAGVLNLLFPGLGSLYAGEWKSAIVTFFMALVIAGSLFFLNSWLFRSEPPFPTFICPTISALVYAAAMVSEGISTCQRHNNKVVAERNKER